MPLSDFDSPALWREDLDQRWPERLAVGSLLVSTLGESLSSVDAPRLLELGVGDGNLMTALQKALPHAIFSGMDISPVIIEYNESKFADDRTTFVQRDLSAPWSQGFEGVFEGIYSLQAVHDFGALDALTLTYQQSLLALAPNGFLVNADFHAPKPQDDPNNPRRFPAQKHIDVLTACGFVDCHVLGRHGELTAVTARKPGHQD